MAESVALPAEPLSVRRARRYVADRVIALGFGDLRSSAELLTSEIVTNALVHAHSGITVTVGEASGRLRVEVTDSLDLPLPPVPDSPDPETTHGRGLWLVDTIASKWGVESSGTGKLVWFELSPEAGLL